MSVSVFSRQSVLHCLLMEKECECNHSRILSVSDCENDVINSPAPGSMASFDDRWYPRIVSQINPFTFKLLLSEYIVIVIGNRTSTHDIFMKIFLVFHLFMELLLLFGVV